MSLIACCAVRGLIAALNAKIKLQILNIPIKAGNNIKGHEITAYIWNTVL